MQGHIRDGVVMQVIPEIEGGHTMAERFTPDFIAECCAVPEAVQPGWLFDGATFFPPPVHQPVAVAAPTLADLQREMVALQARIAAFAGGAG